jgi:hypothetical protein
MTGVRALGLALAVACAAACMEERVVNVRGGLQNMPGSEGGTRPEMEPEAPPTAWEELLSRFRRDREGYVPVEGRPLRLVSESDPEDVLLILDSPQHLFIHLQETLTSREYQLMYEQLLSDQLKINYEERLRDPREAALFLAQYQSDVLALLATMPFADQTPGQTLRVIGSNAYRLTAPGGGALELRFNNVDMIIEQGEFRLLRIH